MSGSLARPYATTRGRVRPRGGYVDPDTYHLDEMFDSGLLDLVRAAAASDADVHAAVTLLERILEGVRRL